MIMEVHLWWSSSSSITILVVIATVLMGSLILDMAVDICHPDYF
jgi:hypothetical protein